MPKRISEVGKVTTETGGIKSPVRPTMIDVIHKKGTHFEIMLTNHK